MCAPEVAVGGQPEQRGGEQRERDQHHDADVIRMFQVKIGIRNIVIPGARMQTTVVIMLTPPRMVPRPADAQSHDPQVAAAPGLSG